jgi:hypothetical protein
MLSIIDGLIKGKMCAKQPLEIYLKMYYTSWVKPNNSTDANISTLHEQIEKKFRAEPQEIQDEVMRIHSEQTISKAMSIAKGEEETNLVTDMETRTRLELVH